MEVYHTKNFQSNVFRFSCNRLSPNIPIDEASWVQLPSSACMSCTAEHIRVIIIFYSAVRRTYLLRDKNRHPS